MFQGIKTTEFWVTIFVILASVMTEVSSVNLLPEKYTALAAAIAALGYAISRGIKKGGPGTGGP